MAPEGLATNRELNADKYVTYGRWLFYVSLKLPRRPTNMWRDDWQQGDEGQQMEWDEDIDCFGWTTEGKVESKGEGTGRGSVDVTLGRGEPWEMRLVQRDRTQGV